MEKVLKIPQNDSEIFLKLINLSDVEYKRILDRIYEADPKSPISDLKEFLGEVGDFSKVITGLLFAFINFDEVPEVFLEHLYKTYKSLDYDEKIPLDQFKTKLEPLFASKNPFLLQVSGKLNSSEVAVHIIDSKVITDIRPIFALDREDKILGSVVMNYLNIIYDKEGDRKEIFVKLTTKDLIELKERIQKAIHKSEFLRSKIDEIEFLRIIE